MFSFFVETHKDFVKDMATDPGDGIPRMICLSVLLYIVLVFPLVVYEKTSGSSLEEQSTHFKISICGLLLYWLICGLIAARRIFVAEHQKLFDALKDGKQT